MDDDIDLSQDDVEFVDDDGSKSYNNKPEIIISYNASQKTEHYYNRQTFDYNIMFMEVPSHRNKISRDKYNETNFGNSTSLHIKKSSRPYESDENQDQTKKFKRKNILPKNLLLDQNRSHEGVRNFNKSEYNKKYAQKQKKSNEIFLKELESLIQESEGQNIQDQEKKQNYKKPFFSKISKIPNIKNQKYNISSENTYFFEVINSHSSYEQQFSQIREQQKLKFQQNKLQQMQYKPFKKLILTMKYENCRKIKIKQIQTPLKKRLRNLGQLKKTPYLQLYSNLFHTNRRNCQEEKWHIGDSKQLIVITVMKLQCFQCNRKNIALMRKDDVASVICIECSAPISVHIEMQLE